MRTLRGGEERVLVPGGGHQGEEKSRRSSLSAPRLPRHSQLQHCPQRALGLRGDLPSSILLFPLYCRCTGALCCWNLQAPARSGPASCTCLGAPPPAVHSADLCTLVGGPPRQAPTCTTSLFLQFLISKYHNRVRCVSLPSHYLRTPREAKAHMGRASLSLSWF